jgi:predicted AAA+ superfamily ATPase/nitroreductase
MFGLNKAFRIATSHENYVELKPINNMDEVILDDLVGYEIQKKKLLDNTIAFVEGRKANNVLLYGDSGTGKSTSIKAIVNEFYDQGLRMIEIYKHQFKDLSNIIAMIKNRNYRFIIYMDDLSFEEFEIEYKFLKAVIEGGVETKPENILIYATSNRRHLIKENWSDRNDVVQENGMHQSDTMEEKLSLVNRFGVKINYSKPMKKEFNHIVLELAHKNNIEMDEKELLLEANKWELSHGGTSGRTIYQLYFRIGEIKMDAIEVLTTRRSCRSFKQEQIKDEELKTILDCGLNAPSGMNKQSSKIVVVQNQEEIKELSKLNAFIWGKEADPFYGAPTVCFIFVPKDESNGIKDGSLVIGAMQTGAYALNIGSCWINRCKEMFELEKGQEYLRKWHLEDYVGIGCCILGYVEKTLPEKKILENRIIQG